MKNKLRAIKEYVVIHISFLKEAYNFWRLTCKYNASVNTNDDIDKMRYTLLRENHTIEKGMSMRNPRKGFGQQKVMHLLKRLNLYAERYLNQDANFLIYPLSTIKNYITYTKNHGTNIPHIEEEFKRLCSKTHNEDIKGHAGIEIETKEHILSQCNKDFASLLYSRHALRYFTNELPTNEILLAALELAQHTPSACNRQGWNTHIFFNDDSYRLICWQQGAKGFEEEIRCSILVTANLKAFLSYEVHQAYVDGGLYAMNLINALHSLGLGTIPLSVAFSCKHLSKLNTEFNIPKNEVPIVIIGVGCMQDNFNVAISVRKNVEQTNIFHYQSQK